jgi:hypothetical protein
MDILTELLVDYCVSTAASWTVQPSKSPSGQFATPGKYASVAAPRMHTSSGNQGAEEAMARAEYPTFPPIICANCLEITRPVVVLAVSAWCQHGVNVVSVWG